MEIVARNLQAHITAGGSHCTYQVQGQQLRMHLECQKPGLAQAGALLLEGVPDVPEDCTIIDPEGQPHHIGPAGQNPKLAAWLLKATVAGPGEGPEPIEEITLTVRPFAGDV